MRRPPRGRRSQQAPELKGPAVNHGISSPRVLVIDGEGNKLGEFMTEDAVNLARDRNQDLIEVAPNARPPVCRLGDYGKMKYEKKKRDAEARKKQTIVSVKEVKLRPKTDVHDYQVKLKATRKFLDKGDKVKVTVRFRGREMAHREIGEQRCLAIAKEVADIAIIEHRPSMEGRQMFCILAPITKK